MSAQPPQFQLPPAGDSIYAWILAIGVSITTLLGNLRSWKESDRNAKYSELLDLRQRVEQLGDSFSELQRENAMLMRYSGHLQYLLAQHNVRFPTLEQYKLSELKASAEDTETHEGQKNRTASKAEKADEK